MPSPLPPYVCFLSPKRSARFSKGRGCPILYSGIANTFFKPRGGLSRFLGGHVFVETSPLPPTERGFFYQVLGSYVPIL